MTYDAFQPWSRLIPISILGRAFEVPENNVLLRCFQYLEPSIPYGPWCWNGECKSDSILYRLAGETDIHSGLSCQIVPAEGLEIVEISPDLQRFLAPLLADVPAAAAS
jgi:hypothetical protein